MGMSMWSRHTAPLHSPLELQMAIRGLGGQLDTGLSQMEASAGLIPSPRIWDLGEEWKRELWFNVLPTLPLQNEMGTCAGSWEETLSVVQPLWVSFIPRNTRSSSEWWFDWELKQAKKALVISKGQKYRYDGLAYMPSQVFAHTHLRAHHPDKLPAFPVDVWVRCWEKGLARLCHSSQSRKMTVWIYSFHSSPYHYNIYFFLPEAVVAGLGCDYNSQGHAYFLGKKL